MPRLALELDALRVRVGPGHLPLAPLGIQRPPPRLPRVPKPVLPQDPIKKAWADLYVRLRELGWNRSQLNGLSYLRIRAIAAAMAPSALNQPSIKTLERDITAVADRTRLRAAVLGITALSKDPEFTYLPDLSPPAYTKFTHGGPGEMARAELEQLMDIMNAAATTRRSFRVAVGVLTDAMGRPDLPFGEILQADMSAYDLGSHEPRRKVHTDNIRNLREFTQLAWTPAWRSLQTVVVGTGMTAQDNPVPKVLSWNPGTDPEGLTLEWTQRLDREYRSTLKHPPHGRADIAQTLARHLDAFDALHDILQVAESGLLEPKIGAIR